MGFYILYGVEYAIKLPSGEYLAVVKIGDVDDRLLASEYYKERAKYYEENNKRKQWRTKATGIDFDLTEKEKEKLGEYIEKYKPVEHGWFDVNYSGFNL